MFSEKVKIGLEVHARLTTKSKLFCPCANGEAGQNELVCPVCLGFPGAKPFLNEGAVKMCVKVAKALGCKISKSFCFSRKSYFYPDMAKNFQITQFETPIGVDGEVAVGAKKVGIARVHIEEDPGALTHPGGIMHADYSLVDYNRSGVPLCEIVSRPDMSSPKEARAFLGKVGLVLEYVGACDFAASGSVRVDANISLAGGERVEVKNITGFRMVEKALSYELARQLMLKKRGIAAKRETRYFDEANGITTSLRKKESEEEYGYLFEPDLPAVEPRPVKIPELPDAAMERIAGYGVQKELARAIVSRRDVLDFFDKCRRAYGKTGRLAKWVAGDFLKCLNWSGKNAGECMGAGEFVSFMRAIDRGKMTERAGKEVIKKIFERAPAGIARRAGAEKEAAVAAVNKNKKAAADFKKGRKNALEFLVGEALKACAFSAEPLAVRKEILKVLKAKG